MESLQFYVQTQTGGLIVFHVDERSKPTTIRVSERRTGNKGRGCQVARNEIIDLWFWIDTTLCKRFRNVLEEALVSFSTGIFSA